MRGGCVRFLDRIFGKKGPKEFDIKLRRGPNAVTAEPGTEDSTFLAQASVVPGCSEEQVDFDRDFQNDYGCDELEVVELIQIAEDIWSVSLMPDPFDAEEIARVLVKYHTLFDITNDAKSKRSM